jgi:alpha-beta hydrolase superfamily lysophospholipase
MQSVTRFALLLVLGFWLEAATAMPLIAAPSKALALGQSTAQKRKADISLPYRSWVCQGSPKVVLLCVHGLGFSSEAFENFGKQMSQFGYAIYAVDVRGFGAFTKMKGKDQVDFDSCVFDVQQALIALHKAYPKTPVFLLGESMGGAMALRVTSRFPLLVDGLISAVPSNDRFAKLSTALKVGTHLFKGGDKPIDVGSMIVNRATANPELQKKWLEDPSNRMTLSAKELKQFGDFMKENHDSAVLIERPPVLMLAGFKDKLVRPEGTIDLFNELSTQDKLLVVVGDGEHLLFEENQLTGEVKWILNGWINSKLTKRAK